MNTSAATRWVWFTVLTVFLIPGFLRPAAAETLYWVTCDRVEAVDTAEFLLEEKAAPIDVSAGNLTWHVTFLDTSSGFYDASRGEQRRNRFFDVLRYISGVLNLPAPRELDVRVQTSLNDSTSTLLATAGTFFRDAPEFSGGTSFERLQTGTKPFPTVPEINVQVNFASSIPWYDGVGNPPGNAYDLYSVLLHEMIHGLGLVTLIAADGTSALPVSNEVFTLWDRLLYSTENNKRLLSSARELQVPVAVLTSNNVGFDGTEAINARGGARPPVYAPSPFLNGTSLAHWDVSVPNVVMRPAYSQGVAQRTLSSLDLAALRDLGYASATEPASCPPNSITFLTPSLNQTLPQGSVVRLTSRVTRQAEACSPAPIQVQYFLDGQSVGNASQNETDDFPVSITLSQTLATGSHTLRARATLVGCAEPCAAAEATRTITVIEAPSLHVDPNPASGYDFGNVNLNTTETATFTLTVTGTGSLNITVTVSGAAFSCTSSPEFSLSVGGTAYTQVTFQPTEKTAYTGSVTFTTNVGQVITVPLRGTGVKTGVFGCYAVPSGNAAASAQSDFWVGAAVFCVLLFCARRRGHAKIDAC